MKRDSTLIKVMVIALILLAINQETFSMKNGFQSQLNKYKDAYCMKPRLHQFLSDENGTRLLKDSVWETNHHIRSLNPQIIGLAEELNLNESHYNRNLGEWFPLYFNPEILYADSVAWISSGDGYFEYPNKAFFCYHLGENDKWTKKITLTVKAFSFSGNGSFAIDSIMLFVPSQIVELFSNNSFTGLSSYLNKNDTPVPVVVKPLVGPGPGSDNLIIMIDKSGHYYWPEQTPPNNQLGNWNAIGYKAKLQHDDYLPIYGDTLVDQTFTVNGYFTYLPVLTNHTVAINDIFAGHIGNVLLIRDWNNGKAWTSGASSLDSLNPGETYLLLAKSPVQTYSIDYPNYDLDAPLLKPNQINPINEYPPVWNVPETGRVESHFLIVKLEANPRINNIPLQDGDYIGAFFVGDNSELVCGGAACWKGDANIVFSMTADDPQTANHKEGFSYSETIHYKLFSFTTMKDYEVDSITFDLTPGSGYNSGVKFYPLALSCATNLQAVEFLDFYILPSENPICLGTELTLIAKEFIGNGGPYTFFWSSDPPGFNFNTQYPPPTTPDETTTYYLTVVGNSYASQHELTIKVLEDNMVVSAGGDLSVCDNISFVEVSGVANNYGSINWETSGSGSFIVDNQLDAVYFPGFHDILAGSVELCLNGVPIDSTCTQAVEDCMRIYFNSSPIAFAGNNATICENESFVLDGAYANDYMTIAWTTSGDGTFDEPTLLETNYNPGYMDLLLGNAHLCLTATAEEPCQDATSCLTLTIRHNSIAEAGLDASICEGESFSIENAFASYYSDLAWTTSGDGTFSDAYIINPTYTPGLNDILTGQVDLCLVLNSQFCDGAIDCLVLSILSSAEILVNAEELTQQIATGQTEDQTITITNVGECNLNWNLAVGIENPVVWLSANTLSGSLPHNESFDIVITFISDELIPGIYNSSIVFTSNDPVTIRLEIPVQLTVLIPVKQTITINPGWSGISTYLSPLTDNVESLLQPILTNLIIIQNETGMYWPAQNVNTIGAWDTQKGYKIKVANTVDLTITGIIENTKTLQFYSGWNLMPVLSECAVDVAALFSGTNPVIVKEVAGWRVFWPAMGINSLGFLEPGKAFLVLMSGNGQVEFPECNGLKPIIIRDQTDFENLSGYIPHTRQFIKPTAGTHTIAIKTETVEKLFTGDILGAFDKYGQFYGLSLWQDENTVITLFADDPTTSIKDGFDENEPIQFRLFRQNTTQEFLLEVNFDQGMPNPDLLFRGNGLSAIKEIGLLPAGISSFDLQTDVVINPNPANDEFTLLIGGNNFDKGVLSIYSIDGRYVKTVNLVANPTKIDVSEMRSGVYLLNIEIRSKIINKRLLKQ